MFTKSMEHIISVHEQKQCIVQFMFTNRTAKICLQKAVQSSIHVHSFSAGQRQNYQRFQNTIATFYVSKMHLYWPFLKCVFINLKIRSGMVEA